MQSHLTAGTGHAPWEHVEAGSGSSKCNFVKLQTICNLNICKKYKLTEGIQPLISEGGCITASPLPLFQPNPTELRCYFLLQGTTLWMHRIRTCTNSFQAAVKPQLNCIKDQSKPKIFRSISFRLNSRFCFGSTFSGVNEDIERDLSWHPITPSVLPITYSPGLSPHSE